MTSYWLFLFAVVVGYLTFGALLWIRDYYLTKRYGHRLTESFDKAKSKDRH